MVTIELAAVPNQSLTVTLAGNRYAITLKATGTVMAATIERNGVALVSGQRVVAGEPIIPYRYLAEDGNFIISTEGNALPDWQEFGASQFLFFASAAELAGG